MLHLAGIIVKGTQALCGVAGGVIGSESKKGSRGSCSSVGFQPPSFGLALTQEPDVYTTEVGLLWSIKDRGWGGSHRGSPEDSLKTNDLHNPLLFQRGNPKNSVLK